MRYITFLPGLVLWRVIIASGTGDYAFIGSSFEECIGYHGNECYTDYSGCRALPPYRLATSKKHLRLKQSHVCAGWLGCSISNRAKFALDTRRDGWQTIADRCDTHRPVRIALG